MTENQNPIKLHQLGAEFVSLDRISSIVDEGGMLPIFGIVPWKHHLLLTSKCKFVEEAFYYMARIIDEGLSKRELEDVIDNGDVLSDYSLYILPDRSSGDICVVCL